MPLPFLIFSQIAFALASISFAPLLEQSVTLALCVLALYVLFYHKLFSVTFDESFARATGVHVGTYKTILSVLTALTVEPAEPAAQQVATF